MNPETSVISSDSVFALLAFLGAAAFVAGLAEKTRLFRQVPGVAIMFFLAAAAAHFAIIPRSSVLYGAIWSYFVPMAIAMFLIKADLFEIFTKGGRTLIAFLFGALGAALGAIIAVLLVDLGPEEAKLAAVFSATYTGGSLNFAAVAEAVQFQDPASVSTALAIDNVFGSAYIIPLMYLGGWNYFKNRFGWRADTIFLSERQTAERVNRPSTLIDLFAAISLSAAVCAAAVFLMAALGYPSYSILAIAVLMAPIATIGRRYLSKIRGEDILAMALMYMFFAMIGAGVDIPAMLSAAPGMFVMVLLIFSFQFLFVMLAGYFLKLNYAELIIASLACITGPPVAAAVAITFKWHNLVVPGVVTGVFGYVIGNFIGIGIFWMFG